MYKIKKVVSVCLSLLLCYLIALTINRIVFFGVVIDGESMNPTLEVGEFGLSDKVFYKVFGIERFDIVVFEYEDELLVKRVIGLPNENISYRDGQLYIDGISVEEDFIDEEAKDETYSVYYNLHIPSFYTETGITLEEDEYFVMGDNRGNSRDSRYFGTVAKDEITSKGLVLYGHMNCTTDVEDCTDRSYKWPRFLGW